MDRHAGFAYLAVLLGVCGHASSEFFAVLSGVAGPETSVWRYMIGSAGLLIAALCMPASRDLLTPLREDGPRIFVLSIIGFSLAYLAFHWSLDFATVVQVGTLVTTIPIFVGLANLAVNRVPFTAPKVLSGIAAVAGVALLITDGYLFELAGRAGSLFGVGLALSCSALVAVYLVLARPPTEKWSLLTLGLWNTTITQLLWVGGLAAVPDITRGSYLFFLKPVITTALALVFLTQPITWIQVVAIVVICGAVAVEFLWTERAAKAAPAASGSD